jgi:putative resolvase
MRLSHYAKLINVSYKTAFRWWKAGRLDAYQLDTGTTIVRDPLPETPASNGIALYARVSTQGQKADLDRQVERPKTYAARRGYQVTKIVQEIASGMNDTRPKLLKLLTDPHIGKVVVELRDRLTRFGLVYIEQLFQMQGRTLQVMFPTDTAHELVDDFMAVITSMASRIYGRRHSKERTENIKRCVEQVMKQEEECAHSIQNRHWLVSSNSMRSEGKKSTNVLIFSCGWHVEIMISWSMPTLRSENLSRKQNKTAMFFNGRLIKTKMILHTRVRK